MCSRAVCACCVCVCVVVCRWKEGVFVPPSAHPMPEQRCSVDNRALVDTIDTKEATTLHHSLSLSLPSGRPQGPPRTKEATTLHHSLSLSSRQPPTGPTKNDARGSSGGRELKVTRVPVVCQMFPVPRSPPTTHGCVKQGNARGRWLYGATLPMFSRTGGEFRLHEERETGEGLSAFSLCWCVCAVRNAHSKENRRRSSFRTKHMPPPPTPRLHPTSPFPNDACSRRSPTPCLFAPYWRRPSLAGGAPHPLRTTRIATLTPPACR